MNKRNNQWIAVIIVLMFGLSLFYLGTDGFTAFTAEKARTSSLLEEQPKLPSVTLEDHEDDEYDFSEFEGKYMLMTFIYTACSTVCPQLEIKVKEDKEKSTKQNIDENQ